MLISIPLTSEHPIACERIQTIANVRPSREVVDYVETHTDSPVSGDLIKTANDAVQGPGEAARSAAAKRSPGTAG